MKTLLEAETVPMTEEQSKYMLMLMGLEMNSKDDIVLKDLVDNGCMPVAILEKRLEAFGDPDREISPAVRAFCGIISNTPAKAVMWAYALHLLWRRNKKKVGFETFAFAFPWGLPKEEDIIPIWDSQKMKPEPGTMNDNLLDVKKTWDEAA